MIIKVLNRYLLIIIAIVCLWASSNVNWGKDHWKSIIEADAKGYYAYLPAVFIYHDLNFAFFDSIEQKYFKGGLQYDYRINNNAIIYDKYFAGTSVCQFPFFLIAHSLTIITGGEADGYSYYYPVLINIAGIFYLLLGLYFIKKLLSRYNLHENIISVVLIAITFGTNLFYYAFSEPGMSHIYSFALISLFFYFIHGAIDAFKYKYVFMASILLGLIILIRPINMMVLLILPFMAGSKEKLVELGKNSIGNKTQFGFSLLMFVGLIFIQPFIYYIQTGHWWVEIYPGEGFNWLQPHFIDILFSFKKGLFIYCPILLLSWAGIIVVFKQNKFRFYAIVLSLLLIIYILSSWYNWWYGGSFGSRVFIDYYSIFALLIAIGIENLERKNTKTIFYVFMVLCILLCQVQTYQYRYYIIHWENMDWQKYKEVFLKLPK